MELIEQLKATGANPDLIAHYQAKVQSGTVEVWPENLQAFQLFLDVCKQWRVIAGASLVYLGLDYTALEATMRMQNIGWAKRPQLFKDVQAIERGALENLNKRGD